MVGEKKCGRPFFSVVIPTYNRAELLRRALESVRSQTFKDFEVVVVDDFSTDNTLEVVELFKDLDLKLFQIRCQGIIGLSRNMGIKKSRGRWVAFLDSDDVWYPDKLEKVKEAIEGNSTPILIHHDMYEVKQGIRGKTMRPGPKAENMHEFLLFERDVLITSAVTVRRDMLVKSGGFSELEECNMVEDYEFWIRLAPMGPFHFLDIPLGEYNIHEGNTLLNYHCHAKAFVKAIGKHIEALDPKEYGPAKIKRRLASIWFHGGRVFLRGGFFKEAIQYSLKGMQFSVWNWRGWAVLFFALLRVRV
ncbi:MAG: glycosyltransferase family 2 protein [Desulfocucumaceae bacterium]